MDREECMAMFISEKCHDQPMVCQDDNCQSIVEPKIKYAWLYELTFTSYHGLSQKLAIKEHQLDVPLFTNGKTDSLPNSLFCQTYEKTFIWEKTILLECPYILIKEVQLNFTDSFAICTNQLFQIQKKIIDCDMIIYITTKNIYLTNSSKYSSLINNLLKSITTYHFSRYR